jgi:hypothetical protein
MAEFDPQEPAENQKNEPAGQSDAPGGPLARTDDPRLGERQWEVSSCDAGGARTGGCGCGESSRSDFSGTEYGRSETPSEYAGAPAESVARTQPQSFWVDLVKSQAATPADDSAAVASEPVREEVGSQSQQFWSALVQSQQPTAADAAARDTYSGEEDERSDWQPLRHEAEPVSPAAEPLETEATADRADVAWSVPQSTKEEWESARSEAQDAEASEGKPTTLMAAAVEAALTAAKAKKRPKAKAAKKPAEKKVKSTKTAAAKAKKPAVKKAAAKKPAAKKVVKKAPAPRITKAPTRRAA